MQNTTLFLVTHRFPYGEGETFLQDEIPYLLEAGFRVSILPVSRASGRRALPAGVEVSDALVLTPRQKCAYMLRYGLGRLFWQEVLSGAVPFNARALARLAYACATVRVHKERLRAMLTAEENAGRKGVFYTYWFTPTTCACAGSHAPVVTRAHGNDIFPEQNASGYIPLCRWRATLPDMVVPCSRQGAATLEAQGVPPQRLAVSYLGVPEAEPQLRIPSPNERILLSCSSAVAIKRLDLLAERVRQYALARPECACVWHHVGGGELLAPLAEYCKNHLQGVANLQYVLHGQMPVDAVRAFMNTTAVDALVNVSASEGVPVSMMEALHAGIPIIGTAVGGIAELVTPDVGMLLPADANAEAFNAAVDALPRFKSPAARAAIVQAGRQRFSSANNYRNFCSQVLLPLVVAPPLLCPGDNCDPR
ncbi:glycosyltransferase [Desulfovibrio intestinalis]|uniref:Glycosyltransferase involved in cell wall biosynthesis n=1 Tax=Desulfovibrio intestinalis TaxID=58621 RepID=A0A7W8C4X1_9BACT|nr:glycosyltransferase [Desulfovibrio intestinalis]MBB5144793.1 glycosyltransferase involved in cell wall biosynthesis [Desulfovibrio intestinalis]